MAELEHRMSARELTEWMIYYSIEPFGPPREDYRAAMQASTVANVNGHKMKPADFIRPFEYKMTTNKADENASNFSTEQAAQMAVFRAMMGGRDGN